MLPFEVWEQVFARLGYSPRVRGVCRSWRELHDSLPWAEKFKAGLVLRLMSDLDRGRLESVARGLDKRTKASLAVESVVQGGRIWRTNDRLKRTASELLDALKPISAADLLKKVSVREPIFRRLEKDQRQRKLHRDVAEMILEALEADKTTLDGPIPTSAQRGAVGEKLFRTCLKMRWLSFCERLIVVARTEETQDLMLRVQVHLMDALSISDLNSWAWTTLMTEQNGRSFCPSG